MRTEGCTIIRIHSDVKEMRGKLVFKINNITPPYKVASCTEV